MALGLAEPVSLKLDTLRFLAALSVVAAHASQLAYTGVNRGELVALGRMGVVVFFILSGFVIAYVCDAKHLGWRDYLVARLARLHSVFIAALLLTAVADSVGRILSPAVYLGTGAPPGIDTVFKFPLFVAFLHESGPHGMRWLSNGPLWSIAYEFWYYLLFGAAFYLRGFRRAAALAALALIAGPRILLLLPLWLAGVGLYRIRRRIEALQAAVARAAFFAGLGGLLWMCAYPNWVALEPLRAWGEAVVGRNYSSFFPWDAVLAMPTLLLMVGIVHPAVLRIPDPWAPWLRYLAGATFTIYCCHVPLLLLARATGTYDTVSAASALLATASVVGACLLASQFSERRKRPWTRFWTKILASRAGASSRDVR